MSNFKERLKSSEAKFAEDQKNAFRALTEDFHAIVHKVAQHVGKDAAWIAAAKEKATRILVSSAPHKAKADLVDHLAAETGQSPEKIESIAK